MTDPLLQRVIEALNQAGGAAAVRQQAGMAGNDLAGNGVARGAAPGGGLAQGPNFGPNFGPNLAQGDDRRRGEPLQPGPDRPGFSLRDWAGLGRQGAASSDKRPAPPHGGAQTPVPPPAWQGGYLGVAVSGGGDSVALMHLLALWRLKGGPEIEVVTVDHGLRREAAAEARAVAHSAARLGLHHQILRWRGWDGRGNLQDAARRARLGLIAEWAKGRGIRAVALAHTADDQAETVLLRLARGSGVDGLAAMSPRREAQGITWLRPLLETRRDELRLWLRAHGIDWAEDPSNDDPRFDRVKARAALRALEPLGLDVEGLLDTAQRMAMARRALAETAAEAATQHLRLDGDDVIFGPDFGDLREETRLRLAAQALIWLGGGAYRPRLMALRRALDMALNGQAATLAGCLLLPSRQGLRICREYRAVARLCCPADGLWDGRWRALDAPEGAEIRALGEAGLGQCPDWRAGGRPRPALLASPGLWLGDQLLEAPLARPAEDPGPKALQAPSSGALPPGLARLVPSRGQDDFLAALIVH